MRNVPLSSCTPQWLQTGAYVQLLVCTRSVRWGQWGQVDQGGPAVSSNIIMKVCLRFCRCQSMVQFQRASVSLSLDVNQLSLPSPFNSVLVHVCFCLYGPFNCSSFHYFSRELAAFSFYSSGLVSALLVLSTIYLCMKVSLSPDIIPCG